MVIGGSENDDKNGYAADRGREAGADEPAIAASDLGFGVIRAVHIAKRAAVDTATIEVANLARTRGGGSSSDPRARGMAAAVDHVDYLSLAAASSRARSAVAADPEAMLNAVRSIEADRKCRSELSRSWPRRSTYDTT